MNITVYLGSFPGHSDVYAKAVRELGNRIGEEGYGLIYGGSTVGLMGMLADAVLEKGGRVIGVQPGFLIDKAGLHDGIEETIEVPDMSTRKAKMIELGDAFIAFPGGTGTLEEISEIMSHAGLGLIQKPCIFYNVNHFYDALKTMLDHMVEEGFLPAENRARIKFADTLDEVFSFLDA